MTLSQLSTMILPAVVSGVIVSIIGAIVATILKAWMESQKTSQQAVLDAIADVKETVANMDKEFRMYQLSVIEKFASASSLQALQDSNEAKHGEFWKEINPAKDRIARMEERIADIQRKLERIDELCERHKE